MTNPEKYQAVKAALKEDPKLTIAQACKTAGMGVSIYSYYRKKEKPKKGGKGKRKRKTNLPQVITLGSESHIAAQPSQPQATMRCFIFQGTSNDIANILRGMHE